MHNLFFALLVAAQLGAPGVEAVQGVMLDADGNGREIATTDAAGVDPVYNYISYRGTAAADPGDVITSVIVYDEHNEPGIMIDLCDGVITVR